MRTAHTKHFKHLFVSATKKSEKLMIVLHGKGDSLNPFKEFQRELHLPQYNFLLLNAPKKFLRGYSWYGDPPFQKEGVVKIRAKLFSLMRELEVQGWDPGQIVFLGFSQGALVSADFGLHCPRRLGGIIGISGYFQFYSRWRLNLNENVKKTPWLMTHGTKDDVLPYDVTLFGAKKIRDAGIQLDWVRFEKKHRMEEEEYPYIRRWLRKYVK